MKDWTEKKYSTERRNVRRSRISRFEAVRKGVSARDSSARFCSRRSTVGAATWLITTNLFRVDIERTAMSLSTVEKSSITRSTHFYWIAQRWVFSFSPSTANSISTEPPHGIIFKPCWWANFSTSGLILAILSGELFPIPVITVSCWIFSDRHWSIVLWRYSRASATYRPCKSMTSFARSRLKCSKNSWAACRFRSFACW